jgi:hypothetical protein
MHASVIQLARIWHTRSKLVDPSPRDLMTIWTQVHAPESTLNQCQQPQGYYQRQQYKIRLVLPPRNWPGLAYIHAIETPVFGVHTSRRLGLPL